MGHGQGFREFYLQFGSGAKDVVAVAADQSQHDVERLSRLADLMHRNGHPARPDNRVIPAGYTYLAQFAIHDLVRTGAMRIGETAETVEVDNFESGRFDLKSLYGAGGAVNPLLYADEPDTSARERFRIGRINTKVGLTYGAGKPNDIPRMRIGGWSGNSGEKPAYEALLGDQRNADNQILAQLTVLFLKLHNIVHKLLPKKADVDRFRHARAIVARAYRAIVWDDLLPKIADTSSIARNQPGERGRPPANEAMFAGLRFGHAMVRGDYALNLGPGGVPTIRSLESLFGFSAFEDRSRPLELGWEIDWSLFFFDVNTPPNNGANFAKAFGLALARPLADIPASATTPIPSSAATSVYPSALAFRTLMKGQVVRLPTGQQFALGLKSRGIDFDPLSTDEIAGVLGDKAGPLNGNPLTPEDIEALSVDTPLFTYLLIEAGLRGKGERLGVVGGEIVARAFADAMAEPRWMNDFQSGEIDQRMPRTMPALVRYIAENEDKAT